MEDPIGRDTMMLGGPVSDPTGPLGLRNVVSFGWPGANIG